MNQKLLLPALLVALVITTAQLSAQTNIPFYVDSFTRTGALNGTAPDVVDTNSAVWSATTDWTTSGTAAQGTNTSGTPNFCGFPIMLSAGNTYRVSFDVNALATTSADPTTWIGLGFFAMSDSSGSVFSGNFVAWMLAKVNGDAQSFAGYQNWNAVGAAGFGGTGHFSVTVGVAGDGSATVQYAKNGQVFNTASLTSSDVSQVTGVGMPIYNAAATVANFNVQILLAPTVAVTLSPSNSVYSGTTVSVNAGASGALPLTYQWLGDNGGATYSSMGSNSPTLTVDTTTLSGTYHYKVVATNTYGAVTSAPVSLVVTPSAPMLSKDTTPLAQTSYTGESASFSASFGGASPILNWQYSANASGIGATNLPGQTSSVLTLTSLSLGQSGYYSLQASNSFGGPVNSSWANLTVLNSAAQTNGIYIDSFSRTGALNVSSPDVVDSNAATWSASTEWTATGAAAQGVNTSGTPYFCGFPLTLSPSTTYQISVDVLALSSLDGDPTRWFALGFFTSSSSSSSLFNGIQDAVHIGQVNGYGQSFAGWGSWNTLYDPAGSGGTGHYSVTIAVAADGSGTAVFGKNGAAFREASLTSSDVGAIAGAGIMVYETSATINNFRVETSVSFLPPTLTMQLSGSSPQLNWTAGATLLETTNLSRPWSTNSSTPPLTITPTDPQHFYRAQIP